MNIDRLKEELTLEEGERLTLYPDQFGYVTGGIGHNFSARPAFGLTKVGERLTPAQEHALFIDDCDSAIKDLDERLPWWAKLDDVRQNVLLDMCFNLGITRLLGFVRTLQALESGDFPGTAQGMMSSRWARQVGPRAARLEKMMLTGEWPDEAA